MLSTFCASHIRNMFVCLFKFCGAIFFSQIKIEINKNYYFCCCRIHAFEKFNSISTLTTFLTETRFAKKSNFFSNFANCANTNTKRAQRKEWIGRKRERQPNECPYRMNRALAIVCFIQSYKYCVCRKFYLNFNRNRHEQTLAFSTDKQIGFFSLSFSFWWTPSKTKTEQKMLFKKNQNQHNSIDALAF